MNNFGRVHPLDKLIHDDSLFLLEAMVPFVEYRYKLPLIFYIKYREINLLMQCMNDRKYIAECGFDCHPENQEEMLGSILNFMPGDYAASFKQMQQMMSMMEAMNYMQSQSDNQNQFNDQQNFSNSFFNETEHSSYNNYNNNTEEQSPSDSLYESVMSILNERN